MNITFNNGAVTAGNGFSGYSEYPKVTQGTDVKTENGYRNTYRIYYLQQSSTSDIEEAYQGELISSKEIVNLNALMTNVTFNTDFTINPDLSIKEIVSTESCSSGRSWQKTAADGSVYFIAVTKDEGNSNFTRTDGATNCSNGFLGAINGWTAVSTPLEWAWGGIVPYNVSFPNSDNTNGYTTVGAPATEDSTNTGCFFLKAGWRASIQYTQTVSNVPAGNYKLTFMAKNIGTGTRMGTNLCYVTAGGTQYSDTASFTPTSWTQHTISFTADGNDIVISMGYTAANTGSANNPQVLIDEFYLEEA